MTRPINYAYKLHCAMTINYAYKLHCAMSIDFKTKLDSSMTIVLLFYLAYYHLSGEIAYRFKNKLRY